MPQSPAFILSTPALLRHATFARHPKLLTSSHPTHSLLNSLMPAHTPCTYILARSVSCNPSDFYNYIVANVPPKHIHTVSSTRYYEHTHAAATCLLSRLYNSFDFNSQILSSCSPYAQPLPTLLRTLPPLFPTCSSKQTCYNLLLKPRSNPLSLKRWLFLTNPFLEAPEALAGFSTLSACCCPRLSRIVIKIINALKGFHYLSVF